MTTLRDPSGAKIISVISPVSGAGRTSTVVNVGWILASAGSRVLLVDLDGEPPAASTYLQPFYVDEFAAGRLVGERVATELARLVAAAGWEPAARPADSAESAGLRISRHSLPGSSAVLDLAELRLRVAERSAQPTGNPQVQLRVALRRLPYDYILVDHPAARPDGARGLVSRLVLISDAVALCFRPVGDELSLARRLAAQISAASAAPLPLIAVPTQVSSGYDGGPVQPLSQLQAAFPDLPLVAIPYRAYPYSRSLAVLLDTPSAGPPSSGPLAAYEELTAQVTDGAVTRLRPIPARVRRRFERALGIGGGGQRELVTICHSQQDRPWAEWLQGQFEQVGLQVELSTGPPAAEPTPDTVVVVRSEHLAESAVGAWYAARQDADVSYDLIVVAVGVRAGRPRTVHSSDVDLRGFTGKRAAAELRSRLAMAASGEPTAARWPGQGRAIPQTNLLQSTQPFVGRLDELATLRDELVRDQLRLVTGPPGTGKSKLIREYVAQYGHDYDFVWWLPADNPQAVRLELASLGLALGSSAGGDRATAALTELVSTEKPWLLVYHNATDPDLLRGLLPTGGCGHVVVTAPPDTSLADQALEWPATWSEGSIEPFSALDAVRLLRSYVAELADEDAEAVVAAVGSLPLALRLAGGYLQEKTREVRQFAVPSVEAAREAAHEFIRLHRAASADQDSSLGACLSVLCARVAEATTLGRLALRLAELCSYLPPDRIALQLITSRSMIAQLIAASGADGELLAGDAFEMHRVLHTGTRLSLFAIDWGSGSAVRLHRSIQQLLRFAMPPPVRIERQTQVLRGLATYAATGAEIDAPDLRTRHAELVPYLEPSGAPDSQDREVRAWLVQHVRYLYQEGGSTIWRAAAELGERLLASWKVAPTVPPDDGDLRLRLAVQLANLYRALGDYQHAWQLDNETMVERQGSVGLEHPRTLRAIRGLGGDLRGLGRFRQAAGFDQMAASGFLNAYGVDHPDTLMATNNLALSTFLVGSPESALRHWREVARRRHRLLGEGHPMYWVSLAQEAFCRRELGQYDVAWQQLRQAQLRLNQLRPADDQVESLRIRHELGITERLAGSHEEALDRAVGVVVRMEAALGDSHPETQAARLALAAGHLAIGNVSDALALGQRCLTWYADTYGADHPFALASQVDLAVFTYAAGDVDGALRYGTEAAGAMEGQRGAEIALGPAHPWTLAAELNNARYLAARGEVPQAREITARIGERCTDNLGPAHPYTRRAADLLPALTAGDLALADIAVPRPIHLDIPRV